MPRYLELEITLKDTNPRIWRRILLHEDATFYDLHLAIQDAMGWEYAHLWDFRGAHRPHNLICGMGDDGGWGEPAPAASEVPIKNVFKRVKFKCLYTYDYGDDWQHEIVFTKRVEERDATFWRRLVAGRLNGPPEDCGGVWGLGDILAMLEADPKSLDEDAHDFLEWIGDWRPDAWSLAEAKEDFEIAIEDVERSRNRLTPMDLFTGTRTVSKAPEDTVSQLIRDVMEGRLQLITRLADAAVELWREFADVAGGNRRKDAINASGATYLICHINQVGLTQAELAQHFGVSSGSVSSAAREIEAALDIEDDPGPYRLERPGLHELIPQEAFSQLVALPQVSETWVMAYQTGAEFGDGTKPLYMAMMDLTNQQVIGIRVIDIEEYHPVMSLIDFAFEMMAKPVSGSPRRPGILRLEDDGQGSRCTPFLNMIGVKVEAGDVTPALMLLEHMLQSLSKDIGSHFTHPDITVEMLTALYRAAAAYAKLAPWSQIDDGPYLEIRLPAEGWKSACCSIIGARGESLGLLLFQTYADYERFYTAAVTGDRSSVVRCLSINLDGAELAGATRVEEVVQHRWEVHEDLFPIIIEMGELGLITDISAGMLNIATIALEAVVAFWPRMRDDFLRKSDRRTVKTPSGGAIEVIAPHSELKFV